MTWKYKEAYELLAEFVFGDPEGYYSKETKEELSEELDEIFGEKRRC